MIFSSDKELKEWVRPCVCVYVRIPLLGLLLAMLLGMLLATLLAILLAMLLAILLAILLAMLLAMMLLGSKRFKKAQEGSDKELKEWVRTYPTFRYNVSYAVRYAVIYDVSYAVSYAISYAFRYAVLLAMLFGSRSFKWFKKAQEGSKG